MNQGNCCGNRGCSTDGHWAGEQEEPCYKLTPELIKTWYEFNANTNAFTDAEKSALNKMLAGNTGINAMTDSQIKLAYERNVNTNGFTNAEKTLITNLILTGVPVNVYSKVAIGQFLANKVDKVLGMDLSHNDFTDAYRTKLDGLNTSGGSQTDAQIKSAYERNPNTNVFTDANKTLLSSALQTHQDISFKVDAIAGKGLSHNDYTDAEKLKLSTLEGSHFKGSHPDEAALLAAHPTAEPGSYAYVVVHHQDHNFIWDDTNSAWVDTGAAGSAHLTDAQIKTQYENNPDTNPFDDAAVAKLAACSCERNSATAGNVAPLDSNGIDGDGYIRVTPGTGTPIPFDMASLSGSDGSGAATVDDWGIVIDHTDTNIPPLMTVGGSEVTIDFPSRPSTHSAGDIVGDTFEIIIDGIPLDLTTATFSEANEYYWDYTGTIPAPTASVVLIDKEAIGAPVIDTYSKVGGHWVKEDTEAFTTAEKAKLASCDCSGSSGGLTVSDIDVLGRACNGIGTSTITHEFPNIGYDISANTNHLLFELPTSATGLVEQETKLGLESLFYVFDYSNSHLHLNSLVDASKVEIEIDGVTYPVLTDSDLPILWGDVKGIIYSDGKLNMGFHLEVVPASGNTPVNYIAKFTGLMKNPSCPMVKASIAERPEGDGAAVPPSVVFTERGIIYEYIGDPQDMSYNHHASDTKDFRNISAGATVISKSTVPDPAKGIKDDIHLVPEYSYVKTGVEHDVTVSGSGAPIFSFDTTANTLSKVSINSRHIHITASAPTTADVLFLIGDHTEIFIPKGSVTGDLPIAKKFVDRVYSELKAMYVANSQHSPLPEKVTQVTSKTLVGMDEYVKNSFTGAWDYKHTAEHFHGSADPLDTDGRDGDIYFKVV